MKKNILPFIIEHKFHEENNKRRLGHKIEFRGLKMGSIINYMIHTLNDKNCTFSALHKNLMIDNLTFEKPRE